MARRQRLTARDGNAGHDVQRQCRRCDYAHGTDCCCQRRTNDNDPSSHDRFTYHDDGCHDGIASGPSAIRAGDNHSTNASAAVGESAANPEAAGILAGTIIANRTEASVRYFVEGQTYDLAPLRSVGLQLPRATAVLNLFNCDSGKSESDPACFWDPYLLKQDGFYEVVTGADAGAAANLILREAGAPPANQIWVQNRTGVPRVNHFQQSSG